MKRKKIVILGAGITGLVAGYYLSKHFDVLILEKENFIGGTANSFIYKNFILDYGPHKLYTELPRIMEEIGKVCNLLKIKKKNSIYLKGNYYDFPLKLAQIATRMPLIALRGAIDAIFKKKVPDDSYENYLINRFGKTMYELSFKDYAFKIWNSNPTQLDAELAKRRVAVKGLFELVKSIIFKDSKKISAEYFYYPKKGIKELLDSLATQIKKNNGKIILNSKISELQLGKKYSISYNSKKISADYLISTIPLDSLSNMMRKKEFNDKIYQRLNIIYFILKKEKALKDNWIFFPERKFIFQRVSEQKGFSQYTSPKEETCLMVETTQDPNPQLIKEIIKQLESVNILKEEEIKEYFIKTIEKAYPLYKKSSLKDIKNFIASLEVYENFFLLGRQGLFNYNNMDQCWDMALKLSEHLINKGSRMEWKKTKEYFDNYRIVD